MRLFGVRLLIYLFWHSEWRCRYAHFSYNYRDVVGSNPTYNCTLAHTSYDYDYYTGEDGNYVQVLAEDAFICKMLSPCSANEMEALMLSCYLLEQRKLTPSSPRTADARLSLLPEADRREQVCNGCAAMPLSRVARMTPC